MSDAEDVSIAVKAENAIGEGTRLFVSSIAQDKLPAIVTKTLGDFQFQVFDIY